MTARIWGVLCSLLVAAVSVFGQSFTGTVSGTVKDGSGAVVSGTNLALVNVNTNEKRAQSSKEDGGYLFALVPPGSYRLEAEHPGFKTFVRSNLLVEVQQSAVIEILLEVGATTESVQVTGETPLLQPSTSSLGQVVDNRKIAEFPLAGRNTFALISLTAGAQPLGEFGNIPARANAYAAGYFSLNGSQPLTNETLIDGVPANAATTNAPGYVPSVDAIQEFKVQSGNFTAEFGRTGGGVINLVFKSGGNQVRGSLYEFLRNSAFDANNFFGNRGGTPKAHNSLNQFGGTAGGPVVLPHLYDGHDRTFWFVNYEGLRDRRALSQTYTIPTPEQLNGDFTQTLNAAGQAVTIADPFTTRADPARPGNFLRDAFPENRVPASQIDRVAARVRTFWPRPNSGGTGPAAVNNWTGAGSSPNTQDQFSVRLDHAITDRHKIFGRFSFSDITRGGYDFFGNGAGWVNPGGSGNSIDVNARNLSLDYTYTISPTLLLNLRYGFVRQYVARDPPLLGLDLTTLGFPAEYNSQVGVRALPSFMPSGFRAVHQRGTDNIRRGDLTHSWQGNITKVTTRHSLKIGADTRLILLNELEPVISQGQFFFDGRFTSGDPLRVTATSGHSIASFLLGLPNSGNIDIVPPISISYRYFGGYIQDDFKVTSRLTLNLGVRYEVETGRDERYDRLSYFDPLASSPLGPRAGIPDLRGGLQFAGAGGNGRRQKQTNWNNWGPRFGFAWSLNPKTVIRGGFGLFFLPNTGDGAGPANAAEGFVAQTAFLSSSDGGITPVDRLSSPFPRGVVRGPGSSPGLLAQLGQDLTTVRHDDPSAYSQEWNFNIQRELPGNFLFDIAYAANKSTSLPVSMQMNQIPDQYLSLGSALLAQVPNPFAPFVSVGVLSQPTVSRGQLLRPFPHFGSVQFRDVRDVSSIYHALQLKLEHRFSYGFTFLGAYTVAKQIGGPLAHAVVADPGFQNNNNRAADRALVGFDQPQRAVFSANWELPFGSGKSLLAGVRGLAKFLVSGWQINSIATLQSGFPLGLSTSVNQTNSFGGGSRPHNNGTSAKLTGRVQDRLNRYFDTSVFSQPAPFSFGNSSRNLGDVRAPGVVNFDFSLTKLTPIGERVTSQFRAEFFNGFNHPNFGRPGTALGVASFGVISSANDPRIVQLGLKLLF
jgi:Carboxypeptidase regulatory-like domain